jgi:hypothetical protein
MYIKDLTKDTKLLKKQGDGFLVDVLIKDGIKTIRTTTDPFLAKQYTVKEMFEEVYHNMSANDIKDVRTAHAKGNDSYRTVLAYRCDNYYALKTSNISYGYNKDMEAEKKLLIELDLSYMIEQEETVIESIDILGGGDE